MFEYGAAFSLAGQSGYSAPRGDYAILPIVCKLISGDEYSLVQSNELRFGDGGSEGSGTLM